MKKRVLRILLIVPAVLLLLYAALKIYVAIEEKKRADAPGNQAAYDVGNLEKRPDSPLPGWLTKLLLGNPDKEQVLYQYVTGFPVAAAVAQAARDSGAAFISVEELGRACPKVSMTHLQTLKRLGALGDMPDTSQINLFDLEPEKPARDEEK